MDYKLNSSYRPPFGDSPVMHRENPEAAAMGGGGAHAHLLYQQQQQLSPEFIMQM